MASLTFGELAELLERRVALVPAAARESAILGGEIVAAKAKSLLGEYQEGWAQLKSATQAERVRKGYTANDPLLRSGALRDAIEVRPTVDGASLGVHSDSPEALIATVMEYGSIHVPPRPFIALATYQTEEAVVEQIGRRVAAVLDGGK